MLKIDLHIHTTASGHAYMTVNEVVQEAKKKGMQMIAITDHGPAMTGDTGGAIYFMAPRAPKYMDGIRVIWGVEANVQMDGTIDINEKGEKNLDIVLLGFHRYGGYQDQGKEKNTQAIVSALSHPKVKVLTHAISDPHDFDFETVIKAAIDNNVLLELNLSYLVKVGEEKFDKFKRLVDFSREHGKKMIMNSDAHFLHEIGDDSILGQFWDRLGLSDDLFINNYPDELKEFLELSE